MSRSLSCVAACGLGLLGILVTMTGLSPRTPSQSSVTPWASLADQPLDQEQPRQQQAERTILSLVRALPDIAQLAAPTLHPSVRPVARPVEPPGRPELRPFWAKGPLVARVSDSSFGPRLRPADLLIPRPPTTLAKASDLLCIAVAIYHEARDQPLDGQLAVASVILNRTKEPERWGHTPCEVVAPVQFSFMTGSTTFPPIEEPEAWAIAVEMARETLERGPSSLVGEADHYHTPAVDPSWNEDMLHVIRIDDHIFFKDTMTQG